MMKLGFDISGWQKKVDFQQAASRGISFAFIRGLYGLMADSFLQANLEGAGAAGMARGVYVYYLASLDPAKVMERLVELMGGNSFELGIVADLEYSAKYDGAVNYPKADYAARVLALLEGLEKEFNRQPIIYSSPSFITQRLNNPAFGQYPLWIAHYTNTAPMVPLPFAPLRFQAWQFTCKGNGRYYGVESASVDLDVMAEREPSPWIEQTRGVGVDLASERALPGERGEREKGVKGRWWRKVEDGRAKGKEKQG